MATDWAEFAKNVAPVATGFIGVAGVWVGSRLNGRTQRQAFLRERIFAEMTRRREVGTRFKKALWLYSRRVETFRNVAGEVVERKTKGRDSSDLKFDLTGARDLQLQTIEAFADLEGFATIEVQVPARNCMEALTKSFNAASELKVTEARGQYAFHQQQYEVLMTELNKEGEQFNAIIDATFTPLRRILFRRILRKPPPYKAPLAPTELREPREGVKYK